MRTLLLYLVVSFSTQIKADCGCADEIVKEMERERIEDWKYHGCRNCEEPALSTDACPDFGFKCSTDYQITTNVLSPTDTCQCSEARCVGSAKLAFDKKIVNKIRCNNSEWIVGDIKADKVVCAKSCNIGACKAYHPQASSDFAPLKVKSADAESKCATAVCDPDYGGGVALLTDSGSFSTLLTGVSTITCTAEGTWNMDVGAQSEYLMCLASPCGPWRCKTWVFGPGMISGAVIPLTVTGHGKQCATATCSEGFMLMTSDGNVGEPLDDSLITCTEDGTWLDSAKSRHDFVMCKQPPCKNECNPAPLIVTFPAGANEVVTFSAPNRKDCTFSCDANHGLFRLDTLIRAPIAVLGATCEGTGKYRVSETLSVDQIGCYKCDLPDGPVAEDNGGDGKAMMNNCVVSCSNGFDLEYSIDGEKFIPVDHLYRFFVDPKVNGGWYNSQTGETWALVVLVCTPSAAP